MNGLPPAVGRAIGVACAVFFPIWVGAVEALRVAQLDCKDGVHLSARAMPLSQVLRRMSEVLGFRLDYQANDDPRIDSEARQTPLDLMNALSLRANVMVRYAPDRRCPGHLRITRVWVLPGGSSARLEGATANSVAPSATMPAQPLIENDPGNREHMHTHGVQPQPTVMPALPSAAATATGSPGTPGVAASVSTSPPQVTR